MNRKYKIEKTVSTEFYVECRAMKARQWSIYSYIHPRDNIEEIYLNLKSISKEVKLKFRIVESKKEVTRRLIKEIL